MRTETKRKEPKILDLSIDDAIRIMEASANCGISLLKFRGLEIQLGQKAGTDYAPLGVAEAQRPSIPVAEMTDKQLKANNEDAHVKDEIRLREEQLEELKITNPALYEQMVNEGELEDDATEPADDDIIDE